MVIANSVYTVNDNELPTSFFGCFLRKIDVRAHFLGLLTFILAFDIFFCHCSCSPIDVGSPKTWGLISTFECQNSILSIRYYNSKNHFYIRCSALRYHFNICTAIDTSQGVFYNNCWLTGTESRVWVVV